MFSNSFHAAGGRRANMAIEISKCARHSLVCRSTIGPTMVETGKKF